MFKRKSAKERRAALRARTESNYKNRESYGRSGVRLLDLSDYPNISVFKPKDGKKHKIDIIPWIIQTENHPQGMEPGLEDYVLDIWVHYGVGTMESTYICLERTFGKPCPICEERKAMKEDEDADEKEIRNLVPKHRAIYNLIDLDDEGKGVQLFNVSHWNFEKELTEEAKTAEDETVVFSDLNKGRTIKFRANEVQRKGYKPFFEFKSFGFEERDPIDESILDEAVPLDVVVHIPTYEEVKAAFLNLSMDDGDDNPRKISKAGEITDEEDEDEEETPKSNKRKSKKDKPKEIEPEDPTDDDDDEEEEEEETSLEDMTRGELKKYIKENKLGIKVTRGMSTEDIVKEINNILVGAEEEEEDDDDDEKPKCPYGYEFGDDWDEYPKCKKCKKNKECGDYLPF